LGLEFVVTLWCNMCFLSLSLSLSLSLAVGRVRVPPSSLQLLVVFFIVWSAGVSMNQSWLWSIRGVLSCQFDTRVRKIRNKVSIRQNLLHNPPLQSRVSTTLCLLTGSQRYFCLMSNFFFDQMLDLPFLGGWILTRILLFS